MSDTPKHPAAKPDLPHDEAHPTRGFIGKAAKRVETFCLLPEVPAHMHNAFVAWVHSLSHPRNYLSTEDCAERNIRPVADIAQVNPSPTAEKNAQEFAHIMAHAELFSVTDAASCQVRNYEDHSEASVAKDTFGYRGADNQCHVTNDPAAAVKFRKQYPQTPSR